MEKGNRMRHSSLTTLAALVALAAACLAFSGVTAPSAALADQQHRSYLRVGETGSGTARQITLGLNKSMIVELPREVREVMVSNPSQIDAVLQSATRAYLIGKATGEANILFIDKDGKQVVALEVTVERDLTAVGDLLNRLLAGSRIQVQTVGDRVVLTGTVTSPIDSTRASEIVMSFLGESSAGNSSNAAGGGAAVTINNIAGGTSGSTGPSNVINMLTVEGREQVLLKVSVVEMERNILKQFGVDLNALINTGNFTFAALSDLPFPINVAGKGLLAPFLTGAGLAGSNAAFPAATGAPANPTVERTSGVGTQWTKEQTACKVCCARLRRMASYTRWRSRT